MLVTRKPLAVLGLISNQQSVIADARLLDAVLQRQARQLIGATA
jgi:hypothetical protein